MDNLSAHDTPDVNEWFDEHLRWTRHFTPKHASWLNQIECWFSNLTRQLLARGSFTSTDDLAAKIDAYVAWYLQTDRPFRLVVPPQVVGRILRNPPHFRRRKPNCFGVRPDHAGMAQEGGSSEDLGMGRTR